MWNPEYWALESRIQLLESRISLKNESRIHSLKIHFKSYKWLSRTRIHATTVMLKCRLADHANRANHADRALFAGEFRDFVLPRKISSCGVQNLETVHTLPKEEKGVHTWIMCKTQLKKNNNKRCTACSVCNRCTVHSRCRWVCKFRGTKEIVYITTASKSHRIYLDSNIATDHTLKTFRIFALENVTWLGWTYKERKKEV